MSVTASVEQPTLTPGAVGKTWLPLALSWLFMTSELVITTAVVARLIEPEVNLAAWGIIFAISTVIQAPAQMLLPSSTALSHDGEAYGRLHRYALWVLGGLTATHALVALTPLYWVVMGAIGAPQEVTDAARLGLVIMIPWSFGTGFRRFQQGVLIRFGHAQVVIWGTLVRLSCVIALLTLGYVLGNIPGVVVAATAIIVGVLAEAGYTQIRALPVVRGPLQRVETGREMTVRRFVEFFWPLVLMTMLTMLVQTLVSVALARLPLPLESLAAWPVLFGFLMMWQSPGMAYTEVVISLMRRPGAIRVLRRFTFGLAGTLTVALFLLTATPLAELWFVNIAGLRPDLAELAGKALWLGILLPGLRVLLSWYQGAIMYSEQTRAIMESVLLFLAVAVAVLFLGGVLRVAAGLYIGMVAFTVAFMSQVTWLHLRSRSVLGRDDS